LSSVRVAGVGLSHRRHGVAPQTLSRARRQVRSAARRGTHDRAAARDRVQPLGRARRHGPERALDAEDAEGSLFDVAAVLGARQALAEIGLRVSDLDRADRAAQDPYPNPTPLTRSASSRCSMTRFMAAGPWCDTLRKEHAD